MKSTNYQLTLRSWMGLPWVLQLLLIYLASITIFGKGPTYIGFGPVYWGEIVLAVLLVWTLLRSNTIRIRTNRVRALTLLVFAFLTIGTIEVIPNYARWGLDALRDFAVCYYALFYFVGLAIASDSRQYNRFSSWWKLFWIVSIPWGVEELFTSFAGVRNLTSFSPDVRGHGPLLMSSGSELAQNVVLGCLLLVADNRRTGIFRTIPRMVVAAFGLAATAVVRGRGCKLAALGGFAVLIAVNLSQQSSGRRLRRRVSVVALLLTVMVATALILGANLPAALSLDRFQGISLEDPDSGENVAFRTDWWSALYDQVIEQNPMFGLGFGQNLADYNPLITDQSDVDLPVRSPHNYNVTVLSRMGIIGALIWSGIVLFGMLVPLWNVVSSSTTPAHAEARQSWFWIAALVAIWINASLGVLMEGPVSGIPFWLILGLLAGSPSVSRRRSPVYSADARSLIMDPTRVPASALPD